MKEKILEAQKESFTVALLAINSGNFRKFPQKHLRS